MYNIIQCYNCGQRGHIARFCNENKKQYSIRYNKNRPVNSTSQTKVMSPHRGNQNNNKNNSAKHKSKFVLGTGLESLANELLFNVFDYLSTADILSAFYDLNARFNTLIYTHFRECYLNFQSVPVDSLETICYRYLPSLAKRIVSICISTAKDHIKQKILFKYYHLNIPKFINLQSLTLTSIYSEALMNIIMDKWTYLPSLTHIKIIKCQALFKYKDTTRLSNSIWSLPKLTHLYFDTDGRMFCTPTKKSSSIEYLSVFGYYCRLTDINQICLRTPQLRGLSIQHQDLNDNGFLSSSLPLFTTFKLYKIRSRAVMMNLLQNMINLNHLTIETCFINLDGYQWKEIIDRYLPNLRIFILKIQMQFTGDMNNGNQMDILLDSFRTQFWLEKHQLFVRCHQKFQTDYSDILLYTIPLKFENCSKAMLNSPSKTTAL